MNSARVYPNISYASVVSGNRQAKKDLLLLSQSTFKSPYKQYFSYPFDLMKYILKNPKSSNGLLKLYKTCKYFYSKNQVLIVSGKINFRDGNLSTTGLSQKDISTLVKPKLWLDNDFLVDDLIGYNLSRIYRSSIKSLCIFDINVDLKDFKLLTSESLIEKFILCRCDIQDVGGKNVPIDATLQFIPKLKNLFYCNFNEKFSFETLKKLNSIKFENKLQRIELYLENLSETFDSKLIFKFFQQNVCIEMCDIYLICIGENRDVLETNLKSVEKEMFPMEKRSKEFKIDYKMPRGFE